MTKFTFHFPGFPHTITSKEWNACAFTQKVLNFCIMMHKLGHNVIHYGCEGAQVPCEHVTVWSEEQRCHYFGEHPREKHFPVEFDRNKDYWIEFNRVCISAIKRRIKKGDFVCLIGGNVQLDLDLAFQNEETMVVEPGIGYTGSFCKYRIFESNPHMHWQLGWEKCTNCNNDWAVVPNYLDPDDFPFTAKEDKSMDYLFFIGRLTRLKGWHVAVDVAHDLGIPIKLAGQGGQVVAEKNLLVEHQLVQDVEYVGHANAEERARYLGNAICSFAPTIYLEPFGNVAIEAFMCGTPCLTSNYGAFTETIPQEYRCDSHLEYCERVEKCRNLSNEDRMAIRQSMIDKYSMENVGPQFERYFKRLWDRHGFGWYEGRYSVVR
jgi:glycosyltransferase involved in cell wall biosynthesis